MSQAERTRPGKVGIEQVPANRRRGGDIRVVLGPKTVGASTGFMGALTLEPGEYVSEHYHPYSEEFIYLTLGTITVWVDGEPVELGPDQSLLVPINARHRLVNTGDVRARAVFHLCPLAPEPSLGHVDTEPLPNPQAPHPEIVGPQ